MNKDLIKYAIGIDPGTKTGVAVWDINQQSFVLIKTMPIHKAISYVMERREECVLRIEDARLRKWFGDRSREKQQGAGSIKRDCSIWEDFCSDLKIPYVLVAPKNLSTKMTEDLFKKYTGYEGSTSNHARDAAMLVFNLRKKDIWELR